MTATAPSSCPAFGARLRRWRTVRGLSIQELARLTGCIEPLLYLLETENSFPAHMPNLVERLEQLMRS